NQVFISKSLFPREGMSRGTKANQFIFAPWSGLQVRVVVFSLDHSYVDVKIQQFFCYGFGIGDNQTHSSSLALHKATDKWNSEIVSDGESGADLDFSHFFMALEVHLQFLRHSQ